MAIKHAPIRIARRRRGFIVVVMMAIWAQPAPVFKEFVHGIGPAASFSITGPQEDQHAAIIS
jgi:hypothetical protein